MMTIGIRIPGALSKEPFGDLVAWCKEAGFDAIDLGVGGLAERAETVRAAGLMVGTVDLPGTGGLLSPEEEVQKKGVETCLAAIHATADAGCDRMFCVFFPPNPGQSRRESFENWKKVFPVVIAEAEKRGVRLAMEGWPGPNNSALGVVPETVRAMFEAVPSEAFGLNYDPSHLVRVGVDYVRFLQEFGSRVVHAHGKDTALDTVGLYEHGNIGTTFVRPPAFGDGSWRYTIPGEGTVQWNVVCPLLHRFGFDGTISIELEDFRYNGSVDGEKRGLVRARGHLLSLL